MGEQTFYRKIYGGMFYMGTNGQIMQMVGMGELMDKRFQRLSQVSLPHIDPELGYWYIIWNVNTTNRRIEFEKHLLHTIPLGLGISCKAWFLFENIFSADLFFDVLGLFYIYVFIGQTHGEMS